MKAALCGALLLATVGGAHAEEQTPRRIVIENQALIETAEARQRLEYQASCALAEGVVLAGVHDGEEHVFPGAMGIAPDWAARAMTRTERRWVSACMLARTNAFGAHVLISMRADPAPVESLRETPEERASHTLYEGGFYGDIFAEQPTAFVCVGEGHASRADARARRKRICATPLEKGGAISHCGFILTAPCDAANPPVMDGEIWPEVIHVWLAGDDPD